MRYQLENEILKVEIDSFGAEIKSVKRKADDREYMWQADKKYWGRTSPVLFPFVGSVKNKEYRYDGKTYVMGQHGFARDMEHVMTEQTADSIWFRLDSTEETMTKYPFIFVLEIGYQLKENQVKVMWRVTNPDEKTMYFSIGAHPAFLCPMQSVASEEAEQSNQRAEAETSRKENDTDEEKQNKHDWNGDKSGYGLYFGGVEDIHHHGNTEDGMALKEDLVLQLDNGVAKLTPEFFDRCTYMVEGKQTGEVALVDPNGIHYVTVKFDTPLFAVWSPEKKKAPFVCIEPWYGRCDATDFEGSLEERAFGNTLKGHETFEAEYSMSFQ